MNGSHGFQRIDLFAALAGLALAACASGNTTKLAATWHEPGVQPLRFQKTMVAFVTKDETLRRTVEDKLASRIPNAVPSYRLMQSAPMPDSSAIRQRLAELGFDGALVMRVADVDSKLTYVAGTYWYGSPYRFGPYWGSAWGYPYDPGYVVEDKIVSVETQIYSLTDDKLVWAGRSETTNPKSAGKLADAVIDRVIRALQNDGLIAQ